MSQRFIADAVVGFQILGDADGIIFVEKSTVNLVHKSQAFVQMVVIQFLHTCVIIGLLILLQTQTDNQKIFPTVVQQILQLQIHGQHPALAAVIRQLAVLDQAGWCLLLRSS